MATTGKTQAERRAQSDAKIIRSAIQNFGKNGYTFTTFSSIAKDAGVTGGLLVQRYETKLNLLIQTFEYILKTHFPDETGYYNATNVLIKIINRIKHLKEVDPEAFLFGRTVLNSTDIPDGYMESKINTLYTRSTYNALIEAQQRNDIVQGPITYILKSFLMNVFNQLYTCDCYGIPCPEDSYFIRCIAPIDEEEIKKAIHKQKMLDAFCTSFTTVIYIYVNENRADIIHVSKQLENFNFYGELDKTFEELIKHTIVKEDQEAIRSFSDLSTIHKRLENKSFLSSKFKHTDGTVQFHLMIPVEKDEDGKILELVAAVQNVDTY